MPELKNGFTARSATQADLESLTELFNEYWEVLTGVVKFSTDEMRNIFSNCPKLKNSKHLQVIYSITTKVSQK